MNERFKEKLLSSKIAMKYLEEPFKPDLIFISGSRLNGANGGSPDYDLVVISKEAPHNYSLPIRFKYNDVLGDKTVQRIVHWFYWPLDIMNSICSEELNTDFLYYNPDWKVITLCSMACATLIDESSVVKIYTPEGQALYDNLRNKEYSSKLIKTCIRRLFEDFGMKEYCKSIIVDPSVMTKNRKNKRLYLMIIVMCLYLGIDYDKDLLFNVKGNHIDNNTEAYCINIIRKALNKYNNEKED